MENHSQMLLKMMRNKYQQNIRLEKKNKQLWNNRKQYSSLSDNQHLIPSNSNIDQLVSQIQLQLQDPLQSNNKQSELYKLIMSVSKQISQQTRIEGPIQRMLQYILQSSVLQTNIDILSAYQAVLVNLLYHSTQLLEYHDLAVLDQINMMLKHDQLSIRETTVQMLNNIVYDQTNWIVVLRQYMVIYHLGDIVITYPYTNSYLTRVLDFIEQYIQQIDANNCHSTLDALESKSITNMLESFMEQATNDFPLQKRVMHTLFQSTCKMKSCHINNNRTLWEEIINIDTSLNVESPLQQEILEDSLYCICNACADEEDDQDIIFLIDYGLKPRIEREFNQPKTNDELFSSPQLQIVTEIINNILCSYDKRLLQILSTSIFHNYEKLFKNAEKVSSKTRFNLAKFVFLIMDCEDNDIIEMMLSINPLSVLISFLNSSQSELINMSVQAIWGLTYHVNNYQTMSIDFKIQLKEAKPQFETVYYQADLLDEERLDFLQQILSIIE